MFTSQLSIMCESGVDLAEALRDASRTCKHPKLKVVLDAIYHDVANGIPVSAAMQRYESVFGGAYVGSIAAAESSGKVGEVLQRLAQLIRNEIRLRSSLVSIFSYPAALAVIASLVIVALIFFVLPQFGKVFERMQSPPPPFTQFLLDASTFARGHSLLLIGGTALVIAACYWFARTEQAQRYWDGFVLDLALFRTASRGLMTGRTFRLLGMMLESGVPLLDSLRLCRDSVRNYYFRQLFAAMEHDVLNDW